MWKLGVGALYTAWDWHEPTRTARWRLMAQWGVKNQKRPPRLLHCTGDAPSSRRDNTEASRRRFASLPAFKRWPQIKWCLASQAKIYATTLHTDAPRVAWLLCLMPVWLGLIQRWQNSNECYFRGRCSVSFSFILKFDIFCITFYKSSQYN